MNGIWEIKKFKRGEIEKAYQFYRLFKIKKIIKRKGIKSEKPTK